MNDIAYLMQKDEMLRNMVLQIESLPSLSGLYAEIIRELQSPNADINKTGHIISRDIGNDRQGLANC